MEKMLLSLRRANYWLAKQQKTTKEIVDYKNWVMNCLAYY